MKSMSVPDFPTLFTAPASPVLSDLPTSYEGLMNKQEGKQLLADQQKLLREWQEKLYSEGRQSLLIILQAMDAGGKDSLIEHVFGGVNPQGCEVTSFKVPSEKEYKHDFLWRHAVALPEKGKMGIFNRSYYENVLVCKVHPELNLKEKTWGSTGDFTDDFWKARYESIRNFEKHLTANGTTIIKFFLHISKDEQKERFLKRLNREDKHWKFEAGDLKDRTFWAEYRDAYETAIGQTHTSQAPWYILPADQKWLARAAAIQIIVKTLERMNPQYPGPADPDLLAKAKDTLEHE